MKCPKCQGTMYSVTVESFEIDRCGTCEGLWFDLREQEHLKEVSDAATIVDCAPEEKGKKYNTIRNYTCPACSGPMVKMCVPEQPHIQIEQCAVCYGAFFDAGEFTDYKNFTLGERIKLLFSTFKKK
jgi:Zn-finger nucleic acid-binding protein